MNRRLTLALGALLSLWVFPTPSATAQQPNSPSDCSSGPAFGDCNGKWHIDHMDCDGLCTTCDVVTITDPSSGLVIDEYCACDGVTVGCQIHRREISEGGPNSFWCTNNGVNKCWSCCYVTVFGSGASQFLKCCCLSCP